MKRNLLILAMVLCSVSVLAQENMVTLSGGYVFTNMEDVDENASGWRVNGLIEFNPRAGMLAHGLSVGYLRTNATHTEGVQTNDYTISCFPVYYAPKVIFGDKSFKGFIKGALGMHFSNFKRTGTLAEIKTNDAGFYGGASAGVMKSFSEKVFINLEYEWAYMSNSSYRDGFINTVMLGVGFKF